MPVLICSILCHIDITQFYTGLVPSREYNGATTTHDNGATTTTFGFCLTSLVSRDIMVFQMQTCIKAPGAVFDTDAQATDNLKKFWHVQNIKLSAPTCGAHHPVQLCNTHTHYTLSALGK